MYYDKQKYMKECALQVDQNLCGTSFFTYNVILNTVPEAGI